MLEIREIRRWLPGLFLVVLEGHLLDLVHSEEGLGAGDLLGGRLEPGRQEKKAGQANGAYPNDPTG